MLILLSAIGALALSGCAPQTLTAVWQNEDGTILARAEYQADSVPQYRGDVPAKAADERFSYTFSGWDEIEPKNAQERVYVARYERTERAYTVVWKDADGTILSTETVTYGRMPQNAPTIAATINHQYQTTFAAWVPEVTPVKGDVEYTAQYATEMVFPTIYIAIEGAVSRAYSACTVTTNCCDDRYNLRDVAGQIKIRGNGTALLPKKPYRIKFDKKQTMFGLNDGLRAKSWVLLAEYYDNTMLKNATALHLARSILLEDGYYVSDSMLVEVYLNDQYQGVYLLAEQQQVNEGRIDIDECAKENPTINTGYLVEMDSYALSEDVHFALTYSPLNFIDSQETTANLQTKYSVKSDIYTDEQLQFIQRKIQNTWLVLYDAAYMHSATPTPYLTLDDSGNLMQDVSIRSAQDAAMRVIDVRSLIDTWLLQEICENIDVGWSSFFISVDCSENGNAKLTFEAPWDFDWSLGQKGYIADGFYAVASNNNAPNVYNPWLLVLCNQDWFVSLAAERWRELNAERDIIQEVIEQIDRYYRDGKEAFDRNFATWSEMLTYGHPTHTSDEYASVTTQEEAIAWLKTFLLYRKEFLCRVFGEG
jgi:hypothetical protein